VLFSILSFTTDLRKAQTSIGKIRRTIREKRKIFEDNGHIQELKKEKNRSIVSQKSGN
jgi:hypothetical protein